jgi:alpha-L-rhamnosidase
VVATDWTLGDGTAGSTSASGDATTGTLHLTVQIPPNTTATVELPAKQGSHITEDDKPIQPSIANGVATVETGSGSYGFAVTP